VKVAEQSLAVAQQLLKDNQIRVDVGTMSPLDVTSAGSEVASRTRDLTVALTNLQFQEATLKNMLVKRANPQLDSARVVLKDKMPQPNDLDIPDVQGALTSASQNRLELQQADIGLENQDISVRFTQNALRPSASVFGFYAGSGLQGSSAESDSGIFNAFAQSFQATYPEYAGGFSLSIPLRNRAAQADNIRSQLEKNQLLITRQRSRNAIMVEVHKAVIGLIQGKAQVEAAHKAAALAREIWEGEKIKLEAGATTSYQVILRERDFVSAQQAEVAAMITYAKAMVEMDRARGITLDRNNIEYSDALSGKVAKAPRTPFNNVGVKEAR
jgi:outer membrane protein